VQIGGRRGRTYGVGTPSRPREFHPEPLTGRVGDWRVGLGRSLCSPLTRSFVCECHTISTLPRFQPPPRRTQRTVFPYYALLPASPQSLWDLSCWGSFPRRPVDPVSVEQSQGLNTAIAYSTASSRSPCRPETTARRTQSGSAPRGSREVCVTRRAILGRPRTGLCREIDILKAGGWSLKIRLRDPSAKPIRGQPPTPPLPRPGRWLTPPGRKG
jgi:hypothetical protein